MTNKCRKTSSHVATYFNFTHIPISPPPVIYFFFTPACQLFYRTTNPFLIDFAWTFAFLTACCVRFLFDTKHTSPLPQLNVNFFPFEIFFVISISFFYRKLLYSIFFFHFIGFLNIRNLIHIYFFCAFKIKPNFSRKKREKRIIKVMKRRKSEKEKKCYKDTRHLFMFYFDFLFFASYHSFLFISLTYQFSSVSLKTIATAAIDIIFYYNEFIFIFNAQLLFYFIEINCI